MLKFITVDTGVRHYIKLSYTRAIYIFRVKKIFLYRKTLFRFRLVVEVCGLYGMEFMLHAGRGDG